MSAQEKFQLIVYDGDFGLPSFDVECSQSILYAVAADLPVQIRVLNNVRLCSFYTAPNFIHKNLRFKTFGETVLYLRTLNYNLNSRLNAKETSESLALSVYLQSKLRPYLQFMYWVDQRNREEFTNVWYMKALPFPFNYSHTRALRERAVALVETLYPNEPSYDVIKEYLHRASVECLSTLSTRLGTSDYYYGNSPTVLDIIVYSHIAPLIKVPFPSNEMSSLITMWPNLMNFVKRIDLAYFPNLPKKSKYLREEEKAKTSDDDVSYLAIVILTVSATSLILGFAFSRGLISTKGLY